MILKPRPTTSASNIFRRALCPGSERLEEGCPEEDSPFAQEGDLLHEFAADPARDPAILKSDQRDLLQRSRELEDFVLGRVTEQFDLAGDEPFTQGVNQELWVHRGVKTVIPGHCDKWRYYRVPKLLVILDQKFGFVEVTAAAANYQLRTYACGAAEQWESEHIVVAITQPRLPYDRRVTMAVYTRADIAAAGAELYGIKDACSRPDAPLRAGEEQCRYCRARLFCPEFNKTFQEGLALVPISFQAGDGAPGTVAAREASLSRALAAMPDADLEKVLGALTLAAFVTEPAREEARRRIASGTLTSYTLGKPSQVRKVSEPERAIALLLTTGTVTRDEALACCEPSLRKLEGVMREKTGANWKQAREQINAILAPVLEFSEKKPPLLKVKK